MRKGIHPENYRLCVFKDMSTDYSILTKSCVESNETIKWEDGNGKSAMKHTNMKIGHAQDTGKVRKIIVTLYLTTFERDRTHWIA